jgi:TatD DNase family protein
MFTDSHCHLNFPQLQSQMPEILSAMQLAQVSRAMTICCTMEEFQEVHQIALDHANIWATAGTHPDYEDVTEPTIDQLVHLASLPKILAIGETGLDYYRLEGRSLDQMEWQRARFRTHIRAARLAQKPMVIHTRSASVDTLRILKEEGEAGISPFVDDSVECKSGQAGGVFHCFTETIEVARAALDMGYYISFSGIVTFKTAHELKEVASFVPLDRLLIETDSPYLAPIPYRGKTNTPAYVPFVAKEIANLRSITIEQVAQISSDNFDNLFKPN